MSRDGTKIYIEHECGKKKCQYCGDGGRISVLFNKYLCTACWEEYSLIFLDWHPLYREPDPTFKQSKPAKKK